MVFQGCAFALLSKAICVAMEELCYMFGIVTGASRAVMSSLMTVVCMFQYQGSRLQQRANKLSVWPEYVHQCVNRLALLNFEATRALYIFVRIDTAERIYVYEVLQRWVKHKLIGGSFLKSGPGTLPIRVREAVVFPSPGLGLRFLSICLERLN